MGKKNMDARWGHFVRLSESRPDILLLFPSSDIAMILNDPFTSNMVASRLLELLNEVTNSGRAAQVEKH